jgi:hypothetical protein
MSVKKQTIVAPALHDTIISYHLQGWSNPKIAKYCKIAENTVRSHIRNNQKFIVKYSQGEDQRALRQSSIEAIKNKLSEDCLTAAQEFIDLARQTKEKANPYQLTIMSKVAAQESREVKGEDIQRIAVAVQITDIVKTLTDPK